MNLFKILLFMATMVATSVVSAFNIGYPKPHVFSIVSSNPKRSFFDAYFYRAPKSKGTVVYIYGGGCLVPGTDESLKLHEFGKKIIANGYSLFIPHYRQGLEWDTGNIPANQIHDICLAATLSQLNDIKSSISVISEKLGEKNIYVWGHSYGAFLTNVLALESTKVKSIKGYISSNGWWDVTHDHWGLWRLSPTSMSPIKQNPDKLSRILVVHTEDDERIPFSQISYFKNWIEQAETKIDYQLVVFPTGGHSYISKDQNLSNEFLDHVLNFMD